MYDVNEEAAKVLRAASRAANAREATERWEGTLRYFVARRAAEQATREAGERIARAYEERASGANRSIEAEASERPTYEAERAAYDARTREEQAYVEGGSDRTAEDRKWAAFVRASGVESEEAESDDSEDDWYDDSEDDRYEEDAEC